MRGGAPARSAFAAEPDSLGEKFFSSSLSAMITQPPTPARMNAVPDSGRCAQSYSMILSDPSKKRGGQVIFRTFLMVYVFLEKALFPHTIKYVKNPEFDS